MARAAPVTATTAFRPRPVWPTASPIGTAMTIAISTLMPV